MSTYINESQAEASVVYSTLTNLHSEGSTGHGYGSVLLLELSVVLLSCKVLILHQDSSNLHELKKCEFCLISMSLSIGTKSEFQEAHWKC